MLYLTYFSSILPCYEADTRKLCDAIESADYDSISTNIPFVVIAFSLCLIGIYFNFVIAKFYLVVLISMILIRTLGFKLTTILPFGIGIRLLKNIRKDMLVLKYHWFTHLKSLRDVNHINLITLLISLVLGSLFGGSVSEFAAYWNYLLWNYLLGLHCIFVVSVDVYILFFLNMQSATAFVSTCVRCFVGAGGVLYCNYNLAESGVGPQTHPINWIRTTIGQPQAWDNESLRVYKAMRANFPRIGESQYTLEKPGYQMSWYTGTKPVQVFEVNKQAAWDTARNMDIKELKRLSPKDQITLRVYDLVNGTNYPSKNQP